MFVTPEQRFSILDGLDFSDSPVMTSSKVTNSDWNHLTKKSSVLSPASTQGGGRMRSNAGNLRKIAHTYNQRIVKDPDQNYNTYDTKNDKVINNFIVQEEKEMRKSPPKKIHMASVLVNSGLTSIKSSQRELKSSGRNNSNLISYRKNIDFLASAKSRISNFS